MQVVGMQGSEEQGTFCSLLFHKNAQDLMYHPQQRATAVLPSLTSQLVAFANEKSL